MNGTTPRPRGRLAIAAVCTAIAVLVLAVRLFYVETYALSLPFWDQWDSEGDLLLRPWIEGTLQWPQMWAAHNEHRILLSRMLVIGAYEATGSWDNLVLARFNVLPVALFAVGLTWLLMRTGALHGLRWLAVPVLVAGLVLPFGWENLLVGFQNQFYFSMLLALGSMALAAYRPDHGSARAAMLAIAILSCFTLASGILVPAATAMVLVLQRWNGAPKSLGRNIIVLLLVSIALIGYGTTPQLPYHEPLKAQGLPQFVDAATHMLGWPVFGYHWAAPLLWGPGVLAVAWLLWRRRFERADLMMTGLLAWSALQALAAAYSRGNGLIEPSSRYLDLLVVGLAANAWFAARLVESGQAIGRSALAGGLAITLAFLATFVGGHVERFQRDLALMRTRNAQSIEQTRNVAAYIRSGDPAVLQKPAPQIPYPSPQRLQSLLDNAALRKALADGGAFDDSAAALAAPAPAPSR